MTPISPSLVRPIGHMAGVIPPTPPSPNPFLRTTLPPQMTTEPDRLRQFYNPSVNQTRSMPLAAASNPSIGASAHSQVQQILSQVKTITTSTGLNWRGQWLAFAAYQVNDVVLFNLSAYVATKVTTNQEPDANPAIWTLLSKNLNLRGQWQPFVSRVQGAIFTIGFPTVLTTFTAAFSSNNTAGNASVVMVAFDNWGAEPSAVVTDSNGNNYSQVGGYLTDVGNKIKLAMFVAPNIKAGANTVTLTVSTTGTSVSLLIEEHSRVIATNPVVDFSNATAAGTSNLSITLNAGTVTKSLGLLFEYNDGAPSLSGPPAGFTLGQFNSTGNINRYTWYNSAVASGSHTYTTASSGPGANRYLLGSLFKLATNVFDYYPSDVVEFLGSAYICTQATDSDPVSAPSQWALLAQGTGGINNLTGNYTAVSGDYGKLLTNTSASNYTLTLPPTPPLSAWWIALQNTSTGSIVINPNGLNLDGSASNLTLVQNQGVLIFTDGTNYFTERGFGTITSLPSIFTVNASTGAATLANETANTLFAGPASGGAAPPTFRALTIADIPISFGRKVVSTTTYTTIASDNGKALDVQTSSATTVTLGAVNYLTPAYVQSASNSASTTLTVAKAYPSNNTAGNFLVACVHVYNNGGGPGTVTVTDSHGNSWVEAPGNYTFGGLGYESIWYVENCGAGANTVTVTCTTNGGSNYPSISIAEYSGIATSSSFDTQTHGTGTSTAWNSGNITTAIAAELLIGFEDNVTQATTDTPGAGWTTRQTGGGNFCDQIVSSTGTYSFTGTTTPSVTWGAYIMAFKAALSGASSFFSGFVQNNGTAIVTLTPASGLINGLASISLFPGQGCTIANDGTNYTAVLWDPGVVAKVDLTAQGAAIGATTLYAVPSSGAGQYLLSWNAKVTQAATTSSALGGLTVTYTDPDGVVQTITPAAQSKTGTIGTTDAGNSTTTVLLGLPMLLNCKASTNIQYAMAYTSVGGTPMQYNLHIKAEYLG